MNAEEVIIYACINTCNLCCVETMRKYVARVLEVSNKIENGLTPFTIQMLVASTYLHEKREDIEKSMLPPPLSGLGTGYALRDGIGGVTHAKTPSRKPP
jgi:hypothetical protein